MTNSIQAPHKYLIVGLKIICEGPTVHVASALCIELFPKLILIS